MKRYSMREMKMMVRAGVAKDITRASFETANELDLEQIGYCAGTCGIAGAVFQSRKDNELYVVTARNSLLFRLA